jgi:hypothetical protein
VHSPWVGRVIELPQGRQTALYKVRPLYQGELLEARLLRSPSPSDSRGPWRRSTGPASSIATSNRTT